jgi:hypothetical protein
MVLVQYLVDERENLKFGYMRVFNQNLDRQKRQLEEFRS